MYEQDDIFVDKNQKGLYIIVFYIIRASLTPRNLRIKTHVQLFWVQSLFTICLLPPKFPENLENANVAQCTKIIYWLLIIFFQISKWVEDETTFCLMNLILLFNTSGSRRQLQSPDLVESHQIEYAQLLYRYLSSRYAKSKARAKLAEGIRLVSHCRELHQLAILRCSMSRKFSESQSSTTSEDC